MQARRQLFEVECLGVVLLQPNQQCADSRISLLGVWQQRLEATLQAAMALHHQGVSHALGQPGAGVPADQVQAQIEAGLGAA